MTKNSILKIGTALLGVVTTDFALAQETESAGNPSEPLQLDEEILVTGKRGSIMNTISEKRSSDSVSDVLSADQAGRFPDPNVAEGLARIPGISFQRENDTGQGEFISIRGLDSSFNTVLFDGLRTGTADEFRRTALDIVTADNISGIRVTKSPLPEDASEGIGGIVDIQTRGPLQRPEHAFLSADVRDNTFSDRTGSRFSGGFSRKLTETLGVNFSISHRELFLNTIFVNPASSVPELVNATTLTGQDGTTATFIEEDELDLVPSGFVPLANFTNEQENFETNRIERDNTNIAGVVDWQITPSTLLTLSARYTEDDTVQTTSNIEFDADNGDILPDGMGGFLQSTFPDPEVTFEGQIEDSEETRENYFIRGETLIDNWEFDYILGYSRAEEDEPILSIDFTNEFADIPGGEDDEAVTFVPLVGSSPFTRPDPRDMEVFQKGIDPFCVNDAGESCGEINDFDEALEDSRQNERISARFDTTYTFSEHEFLRNVKFGLLYEKSDFRELFVDISDVDDSLGPNGEFLGIDESDAFGGSLSDNNAVLGSLGLVDGSLRSFDDIDDPFTDIGFRGIPLFDPGRIRGIREVFRSGFFESGSRFEDRTVLESEEEFFTAYGQAKLTFGKLDIIGGLRVEQYEADFSAPQSFDTSLQFDTGMNSDSIDLARPNVNEEQNETSADNFEVLPRIAFNYNLNETVLLRFAYTTSIARPTFDLLAAEVDGEFDIELAEGVDPDMATLNDVSSVEVDWSLGNPDLENTYAQNFDLSAEFYFDDENAITVAVFYKDLEDFIFNSFAIEDDLNPTLGFDPLRAVQNAPFSDQGQALIDQLGGVESLFNSPNAEITVNRPENGGTAEVYGIEAGWFHTLSYLPGPLQNIGVTGNVTLQQTETEITLGTLQAEDALVVLGDRQEGDVLTEKFDFFNAPEVTGNFAIYYSDRHWEATLAYRFRGDQLEEIERFGISQYQQERDFLDFDLEYTFFDLGPVSRTTLFFSANDLLDDGTDPTTEETRGKGTSFQDFASFNGRSYKAGIRVNF